MARRGNSNPRANGSTTRWKRSSRKDFGASATRFWMRSAKRGSAPPRRPSTFLLASPIACAARRCTSYPTARSTHARRVETKSRRTISKPFLSSKSNIFRFRQKGVMHGRYRCSPKFAETMKKPKCVSSQSAFRRFQMSKSTSIPSPQPGGGDGAVRTTRSSLARAQCVTKR